MPQIQLHAVEDVAGAALALNAIVANLAKVAALRHQVQLTAEQACPWRVDGMAAIRQTLLLPTAHCRTK